MVTVNDKITAIKSLSNYVSGSMYLKSHNDTGCVFSYLLTHAGTAYKKKVFYEINDTENDLDLLDRTVVSEIAIGPLSDDGKNIVRSESRPIGYTTVFTNAGDDLESGGLIGEGKVIAWDFSNSEDEIDAPSGYKRKRIEYGFIDAIYVKEGTIYYHNAEKGSYLDFHVVCPAGSYYYKNDGTPALATEDTSVSHYVVHHPLQGSVPMGDELNTESCSSEIPSHYKFWVDITVPSSDETSNGYVEMELYRKRTVIL